MPRCAAFLMLALLLLAAPASSDTQIGREILIDGDSSDFLADETLFDPAEELSFDSWWGENNDIAQMKVTWDDVNLYVAVDGRIWDNNMLLFLDTNPFGGIQDHGNVNAWNRKLFFFGRRPDFFLGTWDNNTAPQFWRVKEGATSTVEQIGESEFVASATFSQGRPGAAMEGALPWALLFPNAEDGIVAAGAEIGLVAVVVSKSDYNSGPDCAPNNSIGMPQSTGDYAFIDNFALLRVDRDMNGEPDIGVSPASRVGDALSDVAPLAFLSPPDAPQRELVFLSHEVSPKAISPNGDGLLDLATIRFTLSTGAPVTVEIYDPLGGRIRRLAFEMPVDGELPFEIDWDGRDAYGEPVEPGIYLATVVVGRSERVKMPLAVVR